MEFVLVLAGLTIIMVVGQIALAKWGSGYTRRYGDHHWKQINGIAAPEEEHYR